LYQKLETGLTKKTRKSKRGVWGGKKTNTFQDLYGGYFVVYTMKSLDDLKCIEYKGVDRVSQS